jgi:hypothetical protein
MVSGLEPPLKQQDRNIVEYVVAASQAQRIGQEVQSVLPMNHLIVEVAGTITRGSLYFWGALKQKAVYAGINLPRLFRLNVIKFLKFFFQAIYHFVS